MACRLPGAESVPALWDLLTEARDVIEPVPADRVALVAGLAEAGLRPGTGAGTWGGFVSGLDLFDAAFFGLSAVEAAALDPQQRLFLEVAWSALENAGLLVPELAGSRTGVYVGQTAQDFAMLCAAVPPAGPFGNSGMCHAVTANRLSYLWDLRGPSLSVDTACSSSLVAVHLAVRGLLARECDLAVAGGVNLVLAPWPQLGSVGLAALAPDGRCRPFDAAASGYVRSEGAAAVVLKRLVDAVADGDPVVAVIAGSAVGQDGATNGLTAPSGRAQREVILAALAAAGLAGDDVDYVEAHGTGTRLGDPVETGALLAALGPRSRPVAIGSAKANLGHLEAAAGVVGLIKAALQIERRELVPLPHFTEPNPRCRWTDLEVPTSRSAWPAGPGPATAGVSSFGFGGTNAHVVLTAPPAAAPPSRPDTQAVGPVLLPLSSHHEAGVAAGLGEVIDTWPAGWTELSGLANTAGVLRRPGDHRCAVVAADPRSLRDELRAIVDGRRRPVHARPATRVAFVYSGQGAQGADTARRLLTTDPVFAREVARVDAVLAPRLGWSVLAALSGELAVDHDDVAVAQPLIATVQLGLTRALCATGVAPDVVVGHSMGEVSAAVAAGKLDLRTGSRVLTARNAAVAGARGTGGMLAVDAGVVDIRALLDDGVGLAAVNGPRSVVLSGARRPLERTAARLRAAGHDVRALRVDYPSHSPLMAGPAEALRAALGEVATLPARCGFHSTVSGADATDTPLDAAYWADNLRSPVRFADAVTALVADGVTHMVEIGPHPILLGALADCAGLTSLGTLDRDRDRPHGVLDIVAELYEAGVPVRFRPGERDRYRYTRLLPPTRWHRGPVPTPGMASRAEPARVAADGLAVRLADCADPAERTRLVAAELTRLLCEVLPGTVSPDAPFTGLGLDSLRAMALRGRLEHALGRLVPIAVFWAHPTVDALAGALAAEYDTTDPVADLLAVLADDGGART